MSVIQWKKFIGQERIKEVLGCAFEDGSLGHAYLLCGASGTGKFAAAIELAMALLCTHHDHKPCYQCESCRKMLKFSHQDFHMIMPMVLEKEHKGKDGLSEEGWAYVSERVQKRIADPYKNSDHSSIPFIPVDWVREVNHAIMRGALESGKSITILDGIDMMQKESANAMLKTLEEPPLGTIMILLTDRIHAVLPTIVSRCQLLRFSFLPPEIIRAQLSTRFNIPLDDKRLDDIIHTGSLGQSIHLFENPDEEISTDAAEFLRLCIGQDWSLIAPKIDHLSAIDNYSMYEKLFTRIIHFVRNAFLGNLGGTENYIMGDRSLTAELKNINTPDKADDVVALCEKAIGQIRARANISLVFVNYAIAVMEIFNGEK